MDYKTEFYEILELAVTDDTALIRVIEKIMKLINNNSIINGKIDEDNSQYEELQKCNG